MDKGLYVAMTGAQATLRAQAAVANNIANKDTVGFKAERVATETFQVPGIGLPTRIDAVGARLGYDASMGPIMATGGSLDIALHEGVWLGVQGPEGEEAWTRAGELRVSSNGFLQTASGLPVMGENGPLAIPPHERLHIGGDGTISVQPLGQGPETLATVGRLRLGQVDDPALLQRGVDGLMRATDPLPPAAGNVLTSGALEGSNVDAASMLVEMINLSRQFEMQVKVLKTGEETARASASLLRLS